MADDKTIKTALILTAYDKMSRVITESVNKSVAQMNRFKASTERAQKTFGSGSVSPMKAIGGYAVFEFAKQAVQAYEKVEAAQNQLKITFLEAGNRMNPMYAKMESASRNLAKEFTGGSAKMMEMTNALYQSGIKAEDIISGVARSTAQFATVMGVDYTEAAQRIGRISTSLKLTGKDLTAFMDIMVRTKNMGIQNFDEIAMVMSKSRINLFGQTGITNARATAAIMAELTARIGDSAAAGQAFGMVLTKAMDPKNVAAMNAALPGKLALQFTDKSGKFLGFENMVAQLGRLKGLSDAQRATIMSKFFGGRRGYAAASAMANMGMEGFNTAMKKMMNQGSMGARSGIVMAEAGYKAQLAWSKLRGTMIKLGGDLMPILERIITKARTIIDAWRRFSDSNKWLSTTIKWVVISLIMLRVTMAATSWVIGGMIGGLGRLATWFITSVKWIKSLSFAIQYYRLVVMQSVIWQKLAAAAQWLFNTALLGCPIIWIVVGIAAIIAAVILLVKHWSKVTAFFGRVWEGIKAVFNRFNTWFKGWGKWILIPLMPFIAIPLLIINNWSKIKAFFQTLGKAIAAGWGAITGFFANLWTNVKNIFWKFVLWLGKLGLRFYEAGKNIIKSIWEGIKSMANKPVELIMNMVKKIRNLLPFSPAKEGPFRDLHRVRIVETIAQSIKPAAAIKAMRGVVDVMAGTVPTGFGAKAGGGMNVTYAPVININGSSDTKADIMRMLDADKSKFFRWLNENMARNQRLSY